MLPNPPKKNLDADVVNDFGREWQTFNHRHINNEEILVAFNEYFSIFPFELINTNSVGFDMGCGSGRWAKIMASKVKNLYCIDPSNLALLEARENLREFKNCFFECADVDSNSLKIASQDFGYCLGVLHHLRDLELGLKCCTNKLKKGAPFLLYLYYRFDNKPLWFQMIWKISDFARYIISRLPYPLKLIVSQVIAFIVYFPLVKFALALERMGFDVRNIPLSSYRNKGFYFMRTDALDRFGTKLEKRITKAEMQAMMIKAGLECIRFSTTTPYWVAVGIKR